MNERVELVNEDYVQSANSLFHFVSSSKYLIDALQRKALCPRYCVEDISYLRISTGELTFFKAAVLQKCFCDIPIQSIFRAFPISLTENNTVLTEEQRTQIPKELTHPELYGKYGIALSKRWGEKHNLQPIRYVVGETDSAKSLGQAIRAALDEDEIPDLISDSLINTICLLKPVRGRMWRRASGREKFEYEMYKNFHDEHEWRYVPSDLEVDSLIANPTLLEADGILNQMSDKIEEETYQRIWLTFSYDEIKYLVVPDAEGRVEIINAIESLTDELFEDGDVRLQKNILLSKILVHDEIVKDI